VLSSLWDRASNQALPSGFYHLPYSRRNSIRRCRDTAGPKEPRGASWDSTLTSVRMHFGSNVFPKSGAVGRMHVPVWLFPVAGATGNNRIGRCGHRTKHDRWTRKPRVHTTVTAVAFWRLPSRSAVSSVPEHVGFGVPLGGYLWAESEASCLVSSGKTRRTDRNATTCSASWFNPAMYKAQRGEGDFHAPTGMELVGVGVPIPE
jgi:hypothetical protein